MGNKENKKIERKNKMLKITALLGLFLLVYGVSYALFSVVLSGTKKNRITTGTLSLKLTDLEGNDEKDMPEGTMAINLDNAYPMTNEEGLELESYEFKVVNNGTIDAYYKLKIEALGTTDLPVSTIRYNLVEDGETITIEPKLLSNTTTTKKTSNNNNLYQIDTDIIKVGEEKTYKLNIWIDYDAENEAMNKTFEGKLEIEGSQITSTTNIFKEGTLAYTTYNNEEIKGRSNKTKLLYGFDSTTEASGLYAYPDMKGGTTYYYRGAEVNNYVSFAGKTWRIVRILEDGSIRLILEDRIDNQGYRYNSQYDDPSYLKYSTSDIKGVVDNWYNTNLSNYDKYVKTSTYCSDMREDPDNTMAKFWIDFNRTTNVYGIYARGTLDTEFDLKADHTNEEVIAWYDSFAFKPDLRCREEDKVESKAALLSGDEYVLAGGAYTFTRTNYLVKSDYDWWTMSPALFGGDAYVNNVYSGGGGILTYNNVSSSFAVRPVITLKATTTITSGSGTSTDPYIIR